jgi:hypothetical protein
MAEPDRYAEYYAGKLWSLLPQIYRMNDASDAFDPNADNSTNGPLQELVARIGAQAATLRRSIDRLWEDQAIDACDDWVIPYIGARLATNLVAGLSARARRLDVARTIYYRQRKGTLPILEELAADLTGWDARVVEFYRRLGRARHLLDPPLHQPAGSTATPQGGYADLRSPFRAGRVNTAFDTLSHTADLREGAGRYTINRLGVFLWRVLSVPALGVTPVAVAASSGQFTFDPTGRDVQLFAAPVRAFDTAWLPRAEHQLPTPIDAGLLAHALPELYAAIHPADQSLQANAMALYSGPPGPATLVPVAQISAAPGNPPRYIIDPVRGRITRPTGTTGPMFVSYRYGCAATIGAGGFDRRLPGAAPAQKVPISASVSGGGTAIPVVPRGTVEIVDSFTYAPPADYAVDGPDHLVLRAANLQRPVIRFTAASAKTALRFTGTGAACLRLDGMFFSGGDIILAGGFDTVVLSTCTFDPGAWAGNSVRLAADGQALVPTRLRIEGEIKTLVIQRCILGPIVTSGIVGPEETLITDSILQANLRGDAIQLATGITTLQRCSLLGPGQFRQVEASDCLFAGTVTVADNQQGCVRYSAFATGSIVPRTYACVTLAAGRAPFVSTSFGHAHYAQLLPATEPAIATGAEDGSEMGAFCRNQAPIKRRSLLLKYQEFMPIGVTPELIDVT